MLVVFLAISGVTRARAQGITFGPEHAVDPPVDLVDRGPSVSALFDIGVGWLLVGGTEAIRLNPDGTRMDPAPFPIPAASALACDTTQCLVVRDGTTVTAQRVGVDGTLIDATPFPLSATAGSGVEVAWASDRYVVTWNATTPLGDADMYAIQVRPDGSTIEPAPVQLELPNDQFVDSVGCNAAHCLIAYRDRVGSLFSMRALRIARDLTLLDPAGILVRASSSSAMLVGSTDAFHLVYWRDSTAVRGARISSDGTLLDPTPLALATAVSSSSSTAAACLPSGCMFGIQTTFGPTVVHVAPDGSFASRFIGPSNHRAPALACGASSCRAASAETASSNRVSTIEISATGAPIGSAVEPVLRGNAQLGPTIVAGATELLVAWLDERVTPPEVRAVPMSTAGPLLPDSAVLNTLTSTAPSSIAGGFGGGTYFVSFAQSSQLRIRRVLADGSLPDSSTIDLGSVTGGAGLAFDGRYFLVAWRGSGGLLGWRLNPVGATIEPAPFPINASIVGDPAIAWHGTGYVALWPENRGSRSYDVYGRRIEPDGSLPDVFAFPVASADDRQESVAMAYGGGQHFAVWADRRHLPSGGEVAVYGTRVLPDGTVLDPTGIAIRSGDASSIVGPTVAWNGAEFIVAWLETSSIEDPPGSGTMRTARLYVLARVAPDGALLDPTPVPAAEANLSSFPGPAPALASLPDGTTMLVYARHDATPSIRVSRIFAREVTTIRVSGAACRGDADCGSGICADGVCCDRVCTDPCAACSVARGAATDGVCGPRLAGSVCRAAGGGICDVDEVCDGASTGCPPDLPDPVCSGADAAMPDLDGGVPADASAPLDAGVDASVSADAGTPADGGGDPRDAASPPREDATAGEDAAAGEDAGGGVVITEGCGCAVPRRGGSASGLWLALALGWLTTRRRRRGARGRRAGAA